MTEDEFVAVSNYDHLGVAIHSLMFVLHGDSEIERIITRLAVIRNDIYINKLKNNVVTK